MTEDIQFYSTNLNSKKVSFKQALLQGQAPDKGLYMPESIPKLSQHEIDSFSSMKYHEIAFYITHKFLGSGIDNESLKEIVKDAYNYDVPIEKVNDIDYIMRLDQGPTASFKDFAARMMARLIQYYMKQESKELTILTATSGDTGSAVAHAFFGLDNIKVIVLFPKMEVSDRQRKQMTTLGKNITGIAVDGKFDDCQAMVKRAFSDDELKHLNLSSANSINFGRLLPQTIYYFYAYSRLAPKSEIVFSVPSGNFGDMMGGVIAMKMGLPIKRFIIAVNENDEFVKFYNTTNYEKIEPSKNCLSNAMNVGHPSNLARLIALYGGQMDNTGKINQMPNMLDLRKDIFTMSVTDNETKESIKQAYDQYNVIIEPHGAVGWKVLQDYRKQTNDKTIGVCLETAHPAKFPDQIIELLNINPDLPESLKNIDDKQEIMEELNNDYDDLKEFLLKR